MAKAPVHDRPAGPPWLRAADGPERLAAAAAAVGRSWTFGYVELASSPERASVERSLADAGATVVGSFGRLLRVRLPGSVETLRDLAALEGVVGLGAIPAPAKLLGVDGAMGATSNNGPWPVFVTVMERDGDGAWGRRLEALGAVVVDYDADTRAYTATATYDVIAALAESDFVAKVEPIRRVTSMNDTAVPAMGADAVRAWTGAAGGFSGTGGASVPVGVMDTGLNLNHSDIGTGRTSICGANFPWPTDRADELIEDEDLWVDEGLHGTHVTGTILGRGVDESRFAGVAPSVRHIRFAKVLDRYGGGTDDTIRRGMDYLARASDCGGAAAKPLVVNMSLGASSRSFAARTAGERKLDATVWGHRQLYVVAQGNEAEQGFSDYGAAKNSLSVAAVHDTVGHAVFTSVGPTADGRLAPHVSAAGVHVYSARGGGSPGGYERLDGTSMAAPSVSGVGALLMDAAPAHKSRPALARARLMASAIRPDAWLDDPELFPSDNSNGPGAFQAIYGLGKVSARTAIRSRNRADGWLGGSATVEPEDGEYSYVDIEVPEGASRLDLVMTWDEPPADVVANSVLNDLDLWLDRDGNCGGGACGEHSSTSRIDNVEWIMVRTPTPGTYRAKVTAPAVYTAAPRAALAWSVIRGPSTPQLRIAARPSRLAPGRRQDVRVNVSVDGYVAAGTRLSIDCRAEDDSGGCAGVDIESAEVALGNGRWRALEIPDALDGASRERITWGSWFSLGEVAAGQRRTVRFRVRTGTEPSRLRFLADGWNARPAVARVDIGSGLAAPERSPNDDFAAPTEIRDAEGALTLDLFGAMPELAEPMLPAYPFVRRPTASLWYEWTAPGSERYHFALSRADGRRSRHGRVAAYNGKSLAALHNVGESGDTLSFAAQRGRTYNIRVASFERAEKLALRWFAGRPSNDDFGDAAVIEGDAGSVEGTTAGATLEMGEAWGSLLGTTWFRWTAPENGHWDFVVGPIGDRSHVGNHAVLAFEGANMGSLRLVSGKSSGYGGAPFPVRSGTEYRIAVATRPGIGSSAYELYWDRSSPEPGNDLFDDADRLEAVEAGNAEVRVDEWSTVEPVEPATTGVRTRWWRWEPPADGSYTWRLEDRADSSYWQGLPRLQVRAFAGESIQDLKLLGGAGPHQPPEFSVSLQARESVNLALGFPADGPDAYDVWNESARLAWGVTPPNDDLAGAVLLNSGSGSISGSNRYATTGTGIRVDVVGRSAVWWTFEAPADGWYRFSADGDGGPWAVTVHDGEGRETTASSRWQRTSGAAAEVLFYAAAGSRYLVSLGAVGAGTGGEFNLRWEPGEAPLWLRYAGRLADGHRDGSGNPVEIRLPGEMEFGGQTLYLASGIGLQAYRRDVESGALTLEQLLDGYLQSASLGWDGTRQRLLVHDCGTWQSYSRASDGLRLASPEEIRVAGDSAACGRLLVHPRGGFVYRIGDRVVDAFAVDADGNLGLSDTQDVPRLKGAALAPDGRLYAAGDDGLLILEMDATTGDLTVTGTSLSLSVWYAQHVPLALSDDGGLLFVVDDDGTHVFSLDDPLAPASVGTLPKAYRGYVYDYAEEWCGWGVFRAPSSLDVVCRSQVFVAQYRADEGVLAEADRVDDRLPDRFNNAVPDFGQPGAVAVSPDGRHVYVSTPIHGILTFERVGVRPTGGAAASANRPSGVVNAIGRPPATIPLTEAEAEVGLAGGRD